MRKPGSIARTAVAVLAVSAASVLVLSATAAAARGTHAASKPPIVLGAAVAQSGGFELYDNSVLAGVRYEMNKINAAGGVDGRKFKLVIADTKTDLSQVGAAAQTVLSKGADVVITTADYDFGASAALAAKKAKKISIGGAGAPQYGDAGLGPYHFNVYNGTPTESAILAEFTQQKGWKDVCDYYKAALPAGITVAGESDFKSGDPSIATQVGTVRKSNADVVVLCSYPPGGASAVRQIRTGGVKLPILGGGAFDGTFWLKAYPKLSDFYYDAMVSSAGDDPSAAANTAVKGIKAPGGTIYGLFGYEIVETIAKGLQKDGGKADGPTLAKALESFRNEPLLVGPTTYTTSCHIAVGRKMAMIQIQNGKPSFLSNVTPKKVPKAPC